MSLKSIMSQQKNFKKYTSINPRKNSNLTIEIPKQKLTNGGDRFNELKTKLEKQKEIMKKTGRRFKDQNNISIQTTPIQIKNKKTNNSSQKSNSKCQIMVGSDEPIEYKITEKPKDKIDLREIQIEDSKSQCSMRSSRVFQKQIKNQKQRSDDLMTFLKGIELEKFYNGLLNAGFDDLQSLSGITTEDLNHLMMRGRQQDKLFLSLKNNNIIEDDKKQQAKSSRPSTSSTQWRLKTDSSSLHSSRTEYSGGRMKTYSTLDLIKQAKQSGKSQKPTNFMGSSFIYMVGSKNWSLQDQVRRACSNCFRIHTQMQKKGDCYYCQTCYKVVSDDLMNISLGTNMSRSYVKTDK